MAQINNKITLKQVSEASGVSIGTVDRIIHNRGRVNKDTELRVRKTIEELGYAPNIHASMLSVRKEIRIAVAIPYFQNGEFWSDMHAGIIRAVNEYSTLNLSPNIMYYNQFDTESFRQVCRQCREFRPDGLFLAPIHKAESTELVNRLAADGVPTVFVDTKIDTPYLGYYGIDLFESARLMADIIFSTEHPMPKKIAFFHVDRHGVNASEPMDRRRDGLQKYIDDNKIDCKLVNCDISAEDFLGNIRTLDSFFEEHPDITVATTSSSRIHVISDWKEIRGRKNLHIYGFDSIQANLRALGNGTVKALVCSHADQEAYTAMKVLIENIALGYVPKSKDTLFPIDILTKYNYRYYRD